MSRLLEGTGLILLGKGSSAKRSSSFRIWYVASLVHLPHLTQQSSTSFGLASESNVLHQPRSGGGFSVVSVNLKVSALLAQWVRRLDVCPNGWVYLLTYWTDLVSPSLLPFLVRQILTGSLSPLFTVPLSKLGRLWVVLGQLQRGIVLELLL